MMAAASKGDGEESCGAGCTTDGATSSEGVGEATEIAEGGGGGGGEDGPLSDIAVGKEVRIGHKGGGRLDPGIGEEMGDDGRELTLVLPRPPCNWKP